MVKLKSEQLDVLIKALTEIRDMQVETNEQFQGVTINSLSKDIHLTYATFMETFEVYESFDEAESEKGHVETYIDAVRFFAFID